MTATEIKQVRQEIEEIAERTDFSRASLVPILRHVKEKYRGIDSDAMQVTADILGIHPVEVHAVSSFYSFIRPETQGQFVFRLCQTYSCELAGKREVMEQLEHELGIKFGETSADGAFTLEWANCMGMCDQGPAMLVNDEIYTRLDANKVHGIVQSYRERLSDGKKAKAGKAKSGKPKTDSLDASPMPAAANDLTFSTIEVGDGLKKALAMSHTDLVSLVKDSELKGRGGAGFPTGLKWEFAAAEKQEPKYIMCNADEGEPGTFKDRLILSQYPDLVLEGMTIGGRAMNASLGLIYLRAEYAYLKPRLMEAIEKRTKAGLLGQNICGVEGFNFTIMVAMGAGAYVCGEETALIESLEGFRGEPRNRPPFPVVSGYFNKPSVVNNVETLAWVPCILSKGVDWFKNVGTESSTGNKLFSVSGDCERPGVYEFPFGTTIAELLREVGGDKAKAVLVGGASGQCVPRRDFERRLAYEDIPTGGSIVVAGPARDMLSLARNLMHFFVDESCGQCTPCRLGNGKLLEGIDMLREGTCPKEYLQELKELANTMQVASKCGLGQSSPVAFLSVLEHFGEEINAR